MPSSSEQAATHSMQCLQSADYWSRTMSAFGPKRTCASALQMSAFGGKADILQGVKPLDCPASSRLETVMRDDRECANIFYGAERASAKGNSGRHQWLPRVRAPCTSGLAVFTASPP